MKKYIGFVSLLMLTSLLILNILSYGAQGYGLGRIVAITLTTSTMLTALLTSLYKPVITVILLTVSQLCAVIDEMLKGNSLGVSVSNVGQGLTIGLIVTVGFIFYLARKDIKAINEKGKAKVKKSKAKINIKDILKNVILYERKPLKLPIWSIIILWSMFLTVAFNTTNNEIFDNYSDWATKFYIVSVLIIPTFIYLFMYTVSNITYQFFGFYIAIKIYTLYNLYIRHSLDAFNAIHTLIEVILFVLVIIAYWKEIKTLRKEEKPCKNIVEKKEKKS